MPRSTTTVCPGFRPTRLSRAFRISSSVVESWRLPANTSCASGKPSRFTARPIKTGLRENSVKPETSPKLVAGMNGASFARFLGTHLIDLHGQQIGSRGRRRSGGVYFVEKTLEFRVRRVGGEQVGLARQSVGEFVSQFQPLGLRS